VAIKFCFEALGPSHQEQREEACASECLICEYVQGCSGVLITMFGCTLCAAGASVCTPCDAGSYYGSTGIDESLEYSQTRWVKPGASPKCL
jgi:hypothetical protein